MAHAGKALLVALGQRVRTLRTDRGWTQERLSAEADVSPRFLHELEAGRGNISVLRLNDVARALSVPIDQLLREAGGGAPGLHEKVALIGLRGAGKTTIGQRVAKKLGVPFIELDREIEQRAGMPLSDVFGIHGESYFRLLERNALRAAVAKKGRAVIAIGGGVVSDPETYSLLLGSCFTVWLEAKPDDHWNRVVAQGDRRPMQDHPRAMARLRAILRERKPLYARAHERVDTSELGLKGATEAVVATAATKP